MRYFLLIFFLLIFSCSSNDDGSNDVRVTLSGVCSVGVSSASINKSIGKD